MTNDNTQPLITTQPKQETIPEFRTAYKIHDHVFHLSKQQELICKTWLETNGSLVACARAVKAVYKHKVSPRTIQAWLDKNALISTYLAERKALGLEASEIDSTTLEAMGNRVLLGKAKFDVVQLQVWREKRKSTEGQRQSAQTNIQINLTQGDGSK